MEADIHRLVETIHDSSPRLVLVTAGAGTQALSDLLGVAGASRTLLEALVPYSATSFDDFLGQSPAKYVAPLTARLMAGRALTRARWLETEGNPVIGLACTATIVTDRPKRGEHRAHIATWQAERLAWYGLYLKKGARDRSQEEDMVSRLMLNALAQAYGLDRQLRLPLIEGDRLQTETSDFMQVAKELYQQEIDYFGVGADGRLQSGTGANPQAVLSGAFNPLHKGHLGLARTAAGILGHAVAFELAATNVDKAALSPPTVLDRIAQFAGCHAVFASNAPRFLEKARLFPNTTFVMGFDTAERILQPRYYQNSRHNMMAALAEIDELGGRFLVAGRVDDEGQFHHLDDLDIPRPFMHLFRAIPETKFRRDISSTELRQAEKRDSR